MGSSADGVGMWERIVHLVLIMNDVGVEDSIILVGGESGMYSEVYLTESTYYGSDCLQPMFSVNQK